MRRRAINKPAFMFKVGPHHFQQRGWRIFTCNMCYAPRALHPRTKNVRGRPIGDNRFLSKDAPHFKEGW